jgi:hypothetical protein
MRNASVHTPWTPPRPRTIVIILLLLLVASVFDALATLKIISRGADEWNPLMSFALSIGPWYFFLVKMAFTVIGSLILAYYARVRRWAWWGLCAVSAVYFLLVLLHLFLLFCIPIPAASFTC